MTQEPDIAGPSATVSFRSRRSGIVVLALLLASIAAAIALRPARSSPTVPAELRSWVVAGWGRHLYLQILPPASLAEASDLAGRVEFTSATLRRDYSPPTDPRSAARITRMTRGVALTPIMGAADNRLEAHYDLTLEQARSLQRDRVFSRTYSLLGPNSNSGMARALRDAGLALPDRVAAGSGMLGEFPGIEMDPGEDVPPSGWLSLGIKAGSSAASPSISSRENAPVGAPASPKAIPARNAAAPDARPT